MYQKKFGVSFLNVNHQLSIFLCEALSFLLWLFPLLEPSLPKLYPLGIIAVFISIVVVYIIEAKQTNIFAAIPMIIINTLLASTVFLIFLIFTTRSKRKS